MAITRYVLRSVVENYRAPVNIMRITRVRSGAGKAGAAVCGGRAWRGVALQGDELLRPQRNAWHVEQGGARR